jgi:CBS domain-containing protein
MTTDGRIKVQEVMTPDVAALFAADTLPQAAKIMRDLDVGSLPVCDAQGQVLGILTDRDIVVRAVAERRDPLRLQVHDVMSHDVATCTVDQTLDEAAALMRGRQVRRVPVVDAHGRLAGILALADVALASTANFSGDVLEHVSQPTPGGSGRGRSGRPGEAVGARGSAAPGVNLNSLLERPEDTPPPTAGDAAAAEA